MGKGKLKRSEKKKKAKRGKEVGIKENGIRN